MDYSFNSSVAESFVEHLIDSRYPKDAAILYDFGFSEAKFPHMLFAIYKHLLKTDRATAKDFDEAVGYGPALTRIASIVVPNIIVETPYDHA